VLYLLGLLDERDRSVIGADQEAAECQFAFWIDITQLALDKVLVGTKLVDEYGDLIQEREQRRLQPFERLGVRFADKKVVLLSDSN
jgi:hypothetical protein